MQPERRRRPEGHGPAHGQSHEDLQPRPCRADHEVFVAGAGLAALRQPAKGIQHDAHPVVTKVAHGQRVPQFVNQDGQQDRHHPGLQLFLRPTARAEEADRAGGQVVGSTNIRWTGEGWPAVPARYELTPIIVYFPPWLFFEEQELCTQEKIFNNREKMNKR